MEQKTKTITGKKYDISSEKCEKSLLSHEDKSFEAAIKELAINPCDNTRDLAEYLMSANILDGRRLRGYGEVEYETKDGKTKKLFVVYFKRC